MRVLLVESHQDTCDLYAEFLEFAGFEVISVNRTDEAEDFVPHVDAVVTGINVRGSIDGLDFVRGIRGNPATATLPVIVLSASAYPHDVARAMAAGCDRFLSKPCLPTDLEREIRCTVQARRPQTVRAVERPPLRRRSA